jgi:DNA-binding MarR family transcriptional regulator
MVQVVTDSLGLANELRPVLLRIARQLRREARQFGLTAGQATLLSVIDDHPGISGRELAEHEGVSAPGMSASLDRLEGAGLVVRTRAADRRRVGITLSDEGLRVLRSVRRKRTAWLAERLERLSEEERRAVEEAVKALARLLEEDAP